MIVRLQEADHLSRKLETLTRLLAAERRRVTATSSAGSLATIADRVAAIRQAQGKIAARLAVLQEEELAEDEADEAAKIVRSNLYMQIEGHILHCCIALNSQYNWHISLVIELFALLLACISKSYSLAKILCWVDVGHVTVHLKGPRNVLTVPVMSTAHLRSECILSRSI